MPRQPYSNRLMTAELPQINIKQLYQAGLFKEYKAGSMNWTFDKELIGKAKVIVNLTENPNIEFIFETDNPATQFMKIRLDTTSCYFGGVRYWLICPNCSKRVAILYFYQVWACRLCFNLAYPAQRYSGWDKVLGVTYDDDALMREYLDMRIKSHKGKPTKRYKRWLRKEDKQAKIIEIDAKKFT